MSRYRDGVSIGLLALGLAVLVGLLGLAVYLWVDEGNQRDYCRAHGGKVVLTNEGWYCDGGQR